MKSNGTKVLLATIAVMAMVAVAVIPFESDDSAAEKTSLTGITATCSYSNDTVVVTAGSGEQLVKIFLTNTSAENLHVQVVATSHELVTATTDSSPASIEGNSEREVNIYVSADRYAHQGDYTLTITITDIDNKTSDGIDIPLKVTSNLSSDKYNKFLGYIPNELDGVFGNVWFTAVVSFFGLLAIGFCVMFIAVPICMRIVMKKDDPDRPALKKSLYNLCQAIVLIWAFGQVLRIVGTAESIIDIVNRIFYIMYAIVGVIVGWHIYKLLVDGVIRRMAKKDDLNKADIESLRPLFLYLGEIFITVVAVMVIMNFMGFNLAAIITSAGILSLGISMGAQDVLKQFFAGVVILATRPFKKGDLVRIGNDSTIYKVRKVNIMNTELENWDNTDVNIMPNSTIETNKIQNLTGETFVTKVYLSMDVAYGTDINKARQLMQDAACRNPHVISDGSYGRPYTRVEELGINNITIKMGMYFDDINTSYTARGNVRQAMIESFIENGIQFDYNRITIEEVRVPETEAKMDRSREEQDRATSA